MLLVTQANHSPACNEPTPELARGMNPFQAGRLTHLLTEEACPGFHDTISMLADIAHHRAGIPCAHWPCSRRRQTQALQVERQRREDRVLLELSA